MGVRGKTPSGMDPVGTWLHDKCSNDADRRGWIAGDIHVFTCHSSKASKPCRRFYLGESTTCVGCEMGIKVKPLGYLPIWRWDGKPVLVIIQQHSFDSVGAYKLHTPVQWGRVDDVGEGVWVKPLLNAKAWTTTIPAKQVAIDATYGCCVLFGMMDMVGVLRESLGIGSDKAVSPDSPLTPKQVQARITETKERAGKEIVATVKRAFVVKDDPVVPLAELLPNFGKNGVHRKE